MRARPHPYLVAQNRPYRRSMKVRLAAVRKALGREDLDAERRRHLESAARRLELELAELDRSEQ